MPAKLPSKLPRKLPGKLIARLLPIAAALSAPFAFAAPAHAQVTVVRSSGPTAAEFPVGRKLAAGERVVLQAGDSVTVIDSSGTQVLTGPGRITIGRRTVAERDVLSTFIARRANRDRARLGVTRGDAGQDGPAPAPTVWVLEWGQSGPFCYAGDTRLFVWRQENRGAARLSIKATQGIAAASLAWEDGSRISAWPIDLAPLDGGLGYTLAMEGGQAQFDITFVRLPSEPADLSELVAALAANGCTSQLERLIAAGGGEESASAQP